MPFLYVDFNQVKSIIKKNFRANQPYHFISPCSKTATGHYEYAQFKKKTTEKKNQKRQQQNNHHSKKDGISKTRIMHWKTTQHWLKSRIDYFKNHNNQRHCAKMALRTLSKAKAE